MKIKDNFVINSNDDYTITIFDLNEEVFYKFNEISTIIYNNIEKDVNEIIKIISESFIVDGLEIYNEISLEKISILNIFFGE